MRKPLRKKTVSIQQVRRLMEGAARSGVSLEQLFQECDIPTDLLQQDDARIERRKCIDLINAVMRRTEDEFIGFGIGGRRSKPGTFSMMAHAVINCATLEKALQRSLKFYELFDYATSSLRIKDESEAVLRLDVSPEAEFKPFIIESMVFLSLRFMGWLIGQDIVPKSIAIGCEGEDEFEFAALFSCPVHYGAESTEIVLPRAILNRPLVQNALSLNTFLRNSVGELIEGNIRNASLNTQIRNIISKEYGHNFPDFQVICEKLNMTPQTLRRRLKEENTSYQEIKDNIRMDGSIFYLSKPELSIDEIALLMGFSEASSFHRAFKKWTAKTPAQYRQEIWGMAD